jgi:hypothetical protein
MEVYLLWHIHPIDGDVGEKLIGVYSTDELARDAASRLARAPGFVDLPDLVADDDGAGGFLISQYTLDEDHWTEGYVTEAGAQGDREPE